jgi:uncharacterized protein (TIGR02246 family)
MNRDQAVIRTLIEDWARAVRARDMPGILAHHAADILMFDVPPPFEVRGIDAYRASWDLFYASQSEPIAFDIHRLEVVAGTDVAFASALMSCALKGQQGERVRLDFRLTVGLRKLDNQWKILHEHHSIPATDGG